jgi:Na+/H+ antiporter NhaC
VLRRYLRSHGRTSLAVAGFLAFPLFFESLMAFSLRLDEPTVRRAINSAGKLTVTYGQTAASTEASIWAAAVVPSAILLIVGVLAMLWRRVGVYVVCAAGTLLASLLTLRLDSWAKLHTKRFPPGFDLVADNDPSNLLLRGEWETNARATAVSLSHWTIAIAVGITVIIAALELRRRLERGRGAAQTHS